MLACWYQVVRGVHLPQSVSGNFGPLLWPLRLCARLLSSPFAIPMPLGTSSRPSVSCSPSASALACHLLFETARSPPLPGRVGTGVLSPCVSENILNPSSHLSDVFGWLSNSQPESIFLGNFADIHPCCLVCIEKFKFLSPILWIWWFPRRKLERYFFFPLKFYNYVPRC